jgi:nitrile hydratase beta subunit
VDGIHDLGGMHGFGSVAPEATDQAVNRTARPRFRQAWEGRVVGMFVPLLIQGWFGIDAFRHGIERLAPAFYLQSHYFERWRHSVADNLLRAGVLAPGELEARVEALRAGRAPAPARPPPPPRPPEPGFVRAIDAAPRFAVGDRVRSRSFHPPGHTRLPRYARGKRGRVERVHPAFVFPDSNAHGRGEQPQYLYTVAFASRELWDEDGEPGLTVNLDLFESYLERA